MSLDFVIADKAIVRSPFSLGSLSAKFQPLKMRV